MDDEGWYQYWESMTAFRNKYAAHRDLGFTGPVPDFDVALAVVYHYDKWVRRVLYPDAFSEPPLDRFVSSLQRAVAPLIDKLFEVTETLTESGAGEGTQ
ncbi:MAG: hypothetical protein ACYC06_01955 [Ilumatobacteraceae bacterium]